MSLKKSASVAVVVAQLVEWLLPIPEVWGSNSVIVNNLYWTFTLNCIEKTKIKKRGREWPIFRKKSTSAFNNKEVLLTYLLFHEEERKLFFYISYTIGVGKVFQDCTSVVWLFCALHSGREALLWMLKKDYLKIFSTRRWRLESAQSSNKIEYCPSRPVTGMFWFFLNAITHHMGRCEPSYHNTKEHHA